MRSALKRQRKNEARLEEGAHLCNVAAAVIGSAVVGGVLASDSSRSASNKAADSSQRATEASERTGNAQLEESRRQFDIQNARAQKLDALTEQVTKSQLESQDTQTALAKDYADYNKTTFRPLEQGLVSEAQNYDTPAEQERVAGIASSDVAKSFAAARGSNVRDMARMGVNPNSGRFAGSMNEMAANEALGSASAENAARQKVRDLGWAKRMDASSLGRNLPSAQATSAGLAITAGTNAVNNGATANNSFTNGQNGGIQLLSNANTSFNTAAANSAQIYGTANQAYANTMNAAGSAAGMYMKYGTKAPANDTVTNEYF